MDIGKTQRTGTLTELEKHQFTQLVRSYYDIQKLRIAIGNRIFQLVTGAPIDDGEESSGAEVSQDDIEKKSASKVKKVVKLYEAIMNDETVGPKKKKELIEESEIKSMTTASFIDTYMMFEKSEQGMLKSIKTEVEKFAIYNDFLSKVKGIGPLMGAVIISTLDPYKARHRSSFKRYAGLDVYIEYDEEGNMVANEARSKKSAHLVDVEYVSKSGEVKTKKSITYNPFLHAKLLGVLGRGFLFAKGEYYNIYVGYRNRIEGRDDTKDYSLTHKHRMGVRYMICQFIGDLWVAWRELEGLEVTAPYEVEKLGLPPHKWDANAIPTYKSSKTKKEEESVAQ